MKSDHDRNGPQFPELKITLDRGDAYRLNQIVEDILENDQGEKMKQEDRDFLNELDFLLFEYLNKYL